MTPARALERFRGLRVAVWGDFVADEFIGGDIARVSREAPVLILKQRERRVAPGGAANAAANLAALGARVALVGVLGADAAGDELAASLRAAGLDGAELLRPRGYLTPVKTRILAGHAHTTRQQVVRLDREPTRELAAAARRQLVERARRLVARGCALLLSDYGYGAVTPALAREIHPAAKAAPITVDSRFRIAEFDSGFTAATPNEPELEEVFHHSIGNDQQKLEEAGRALLVRLRLRWLLVTRGRDGAALFSRDRPTLLLPASGQGRAVDVTGAGDTVIAVFTAALAAGADGETAARLANIAGGLVVMKPGTATVSRAEIAAAARTRPSPRSAGT